MSHDPAGPQQQDRDFARHASLGLQFGFSFLIFCGLGYAFDSWQETKPYGLLVGALVGAIGASYSLYRATTPREPTSKQSEKFKKL